MELWLLVGGIVASGCGFFFILTFSYKNYGRVKSPSPPRVKDIASVELPGFKQSLDAAE